MNGARMSTRNDIVRGAVLGGGAAGLTSLAMLAARGQADNHSPVAPLNATSHVIWGDRAFHVDRPTVRHTLPGLALHVGSSMFWGAVQQGLFGTRRGLAPNARNAALTTALAALVDLKLVPDRLTPGFERRLSMKSLMWVYGALAVGLAIGGEIAARRGVAPRLPHGRDTRLEPSEPANARDPAGNASVDAATPVDGAGSPAIQPSELAEDGKPDVDAPRNPRM